MPHDYALQPGDLLTLDLAVLKDGIAADTAIGFIVGPQTLEATGSPGAQADAALIAVTERALAAGIEVARPGNRIGDISHAIGAVLTGAGYLVNTEFGATASAAPCTATRTCPTSAAPAGAANCARVSFSPWSPG